LSLIRILIDLVNLPSGKAFFLIKIEDSMIFLFEAQGEKNGY